MTPWTAACQASLPSTVPQSLLKLMTIESVTPSNHLILCRPLLLLPSIFPSIRVFSSESILHIRWPKYWSFSFSISPSNEYSGLISVRIGRFDLAVQAQHHNSKAPLLRCSVLQNSFILCVCMLTFLLIPQNLLCTQSDHMQIATILFLSFQPACLYFFPCFHVLPSSFSPILTRSGERGHSCLGADLKEESIDSFTVTVMLAAGLEDTFFQVKGVSYFSQFADSFYHEWS